MNARLPSLFDPMLMAEGQQKGRLSLFLKDFSRLSQEVVNPDQSVEVELAFRVIDRMPVVEGRVTTQLQVACQRCLEPMAIEVDETIALCFIESASLEENVPEGFDAYDFDPGARLNLAELIEDELLLAIPDCPTHADCEIPVAYRGDERDAAESVERVNPFAQLAQLKKNTSH
jgi:uncharacterized protein